MQNTSTYNNDNKTPRGSNNQYKNADLACSAGAGGRRLAGADLGRRGAVAAALAAAGHNIMQYDILV